MYVTFKPFKESLVHKIAIVNIVQLDFFIVYNGPKWFGHQFQSISLYYRRYVAFF